jgi:hypothetical protein
MSAPPVVQSNFTSRDTEDREEEGEAMKCLQATVWRGAEGSYSHGGKSCRTAYLSIDSYVSRSLIPLHRPGYIQ